MKDSHLPEFSINDEKGGTTPNPSYLLPKQGAVAAGGSFSGGELFLGFWGVRHMTKAETHNGVAVAPGDHVAAGRVALVALRDHGTAVGPTLGDQHRLRRLDIPAQHTNVPCPPKKQQKQSI